MGLAGLDLHLALPDFRYRAVFHGIVENEVCPVYIGLCEAKPVPRPSEVADTQWIPWNGFAAACLSPDHGAYADFSIWSLMEGRQLSESGCVDRLFEGLLH